MVVRIVVNLITVLFFWLLDVRDDPFRRIPLYKKRAFIMSSCPRAKCVLMTLNGDILDTVYC